ncbi:FG-GAP repeat domain-containing protein [Streptomyces sp. NPDC058128]|uniref:FG-GAP repeat domain-containing protein n=1 Tax=Streptomyces sp. NPDC058128 TaxID=3346352 RepID=UPI0036E76BD5
MKHRSSVGRLALAVSIVLTATAGPALATGPAAALPAADNGPFPATASQEHPASFTASQEQPGAFVIPGDATLRAGGASGFVTSAPVGSEFTHQWHRSEDGATTALPPSFDGSFPGVALDSDHVVVRAQKNLYRVLDMAGGEPVDLDAPSVGADRSFGFLLQDTLVFWKVGTDEESLHLLSKPADSTIHRQVTGLPSGMTVKGVGYSLPGTLALHYQVDVDYTSKERLAVIDLSEAKVIEDRALADASPFSSVAVSATHLAWIERRPDGSGALVTARRGTEEATRHPAVLSTTAQIELLGDWAVYGDGTGGQNLSAVSLKDGTTVSLLKDMTVLAGADQGLLAQGTTPERGTGVYRIGLGPDSRPAVTLLATNGVTTATAVMAQQVPALADFRTDEAKAVLRWTYGRSDLRVNLRATHKQTGRTWTADTTILGADTEAVFEWNGHFSTGVAAYNGTYEWKMTATPLSSLGGTVERTGTLRVDSGTAAHDYSDNGSPDLLVRTGEGRLVSYDVGQFLPEPDGYWEPTYRGGGWNVYDRLLSAGNLDATPHSDIIARNKATGDLWLYPGTGHTLAKPIRIGGGWNTYDKLAAGSDLTGDGRPDLIATDKTGVLWLYKATGNATTPFAPRKRIGGGWNTYNLLTAPGNIGGAKAGDLLARDHNGVLWLYLGKGDGTFALRSRVGGGWGPYRQITGIGDIDHDGHPDLFAEDGWDGVSYGTFYKGTGNWKTPLGPSQSLGRTPYSNQGAPHPLPF